MTKATTLERRLEKAEQVAGIDVIPHVLRVVYLSPDGTETPGPVIRIGGKYDDQETDQAS